MQADECQSQGATVTTATLSAAILVTTILYTFLVGITCGRILPTFQNVVMIVPNILNRFLVLFPGTGFHFIIGVLAGLKSEMSPDQFREVSCVE